MSNHTINVQRMEGAALFVASTYAFYELGAPWIIYPVLLLAIDISMAGYLINNRIGAYVYNFGHSLVAPITLSVAGKIAGNRGMVILAVAWLAHIGLDRAMGYGLKHITGFKHTHLGKIGKE